MSRLEEIKEEMLIDANVTLENLQWLIQRAERADYLEMRHENVGVIFSRQALQSRVDELERELELEKGIHLNFESHLRKDNQRYKQALEHIVTRKMSAYLTVSDMNEDFIKVARQALEESK